MQWQRAASAGSPEWQQFGPVHWIVIATAAVCCFAVIYFRAELAHVRGDRWLAGAMVIVYLPWIAYCLSTGYRSWGQLLPFYTCDATILLAVAWSFWKPRWMGEILFVWAVLGGVVTILLPDTDGYALPRVVAVHTILSHTLMLMFAVEIAAVERVRPTWRAVVPVSIASLVLVPPSLWANARFGSDYMFVSDNPGGIFTFLDEYGGAARVGLTLVAGVALFVTAMIAWFATDYLMRNLERRAASASPARSARTAN